MDPTDIGNVRCIDGIRVVYGATKGAREGMLSLCRLRPHLGCGQRFAPESSNPELSGFSSVSYIAASTVSHFGYDAARILTPQRHNARSKKEWCGVDTGGDARVVGLEFMFFCFLVFLGTFLRIQEMQFVFTSSLSSALLGKLVRLSCCLMSETYDNDEQ
ncbi:hypothetical protein AB1N83_007680 [Pleurotus pulmonarius]